MVGLMIVYDAAVGETGSPRRSGEEEEETDDPPVMTGATGRKLRGGGYCTSSTPEWEEFIPSNCLMRACSDEEGMVVVEERKGEARPLVAPIRGKDSLACALTKYSDRRKRKRISRLLEHVQALEAFILETTRTTSEIVRMLSVGEKKSY